ncbi:hypothetical protein AGMMS50268_38240 [Spirochaetia bacterium]|nr:hypothetical protein AGMMS50268_38240 [Spirochaetia bacterium]
MLSERTQKAMDILRVAESGLAKLGILPVEQSVKEMPEFRKNQIEIDIRFTGDYLENP